MNIKNQYSVTIMRNLQPVVALLESSFSYHASTIDLAIDVKNLIVFACKHTSTKQRDLMPRLQVIVQQIHYYLIKKFKISKLLHRFDSTFNIDTLKFLFIWYWNDWWKKFIDKVQNKS